MNQNDKIWTEVAISALESLERIEEFYRGRPDLYGEPGFGRDRYMACCESAEAMRRAFVDNLEEGE